MTTKLKSLIYLICFIFASVLYQQTANTEPKEEIVSNTLEQEADIVINPYADNNDRIETN